MLPYLHCSYCPSSSSNSSSPDLVHHPLRTKPNAITNAPPAMPCRPHPTILSKSRTKKKREKAYHSLPRPQPSPRILSLPPLLLLSLPLRTPPQITSIPPRPTGVITRLQRPVILTRRRPGRRRRGLPTRRHTCAVTTLLRLLRAVGDGGRRMLLLLILLGWWGGEVLLMCWRRDGPRCAGGVGVGVVGLVVGFPAGVGGEAVLLLLGLEGGVGGVLRLGRRLHAAVRWVAGRHGRRAGWVVATCHP